MTIDSKAVCGGGEFEDLAEQIGRKLEWAGPDFPNYGELDVPLPAGHWRAISAALASTAGAGAGDWVTVPKLPPEAMWGGLARQIVMWCRFGQPTGKALFQHLKSSGYEIPAWLREEVEDVDHVPPKGTIAAIIYRAMIEAAPAVPASPRSGAGEGEEILPSWSEAGTLKGDLYSAIAGKVELTGSNLDGYDIGGLDEAVLAVIECIRSRMPASSPAPAEHGVEIRERIAAAIRKALIENWSDAVNARDWDEDVLLTGCRRVGGGKGYEKPEEAAQNLALDAADAVLSALSQGGGAGRSEKGEGETGKIANHAHLLELAASRLEADGWPANAGSCLNAAAFLLEMIAAPAQSPSTSDREG